MKKSLNIFFWAFLFIITITVFDPSFNLSASSSAIKSKTKSTVIKKQSSHVQSDVATQLNNQAQSLYTQGKYDEAEQLFRRVLEIDEKDLGQDHPDVAACLNNLALLLKTQGKYIEAEALNRRALSILEKQYGREDPDVASCLNNLASVLRDVIGKQE